MLKIQTVMTASTKFISSVLKYLSIIYHRMKILLQLVYQRKNKELRKEAQVKYFYDIQMPLK